MVGIHLRIRTLICCGWFRSIHLIHPVNVIRRFYYYRCCCIIIVVVLLLLLSLYMCVICGVL